MFNMNIMLLFLILPMLLLNGFSMMSINNYPRALYDKLSLKKTIIRSSLLTANLFGFGNTAKSSSSPSSSSSSSYITNEVVSKKNNIKQKRLGNSDIIVSEIGLGTQRWVSDDSNAPNEELCYSFMDKFIDLGGNLIDTAEQYPIPSSKIHPEGYCETVIGNYIGTNKSKRDRMVISTKITGGRNVNKSNLVKDLDGSLRRLQTDYVDVYLLHWPARYSPQSNWGQSLSYNKEMEKYYSPTSFEDICETMGRLIKDGKIRGYGFCNDNCYGLTKASLVAKMLGVPGPVCLQGDYSILDRKSDENGVAEAASSINENVGFMAYNVLAGGFLTDKYIDAPVPYDNPSLMSSLTQRKESRGRHDFDGWGRTLYRYRSDPAKESIKYYREIAKDNNMSLLELSLRWTRERSLVTTSLLGISNMKQFDEDMSFYQKNALSDDVMWQIDRIHMRHRNPIFSSTRVGRDWNGEGEIGEVIP